MRREFFCGAAFFCIAAISGCGSGNGLNGSTDLSMLPGDAAMGGDLAHAGNFDLAGTDGPQSLLQQLQAITATCNKASSAPYSTDDGAPATIDICKLTGAYFWNSDMDIDCDGQQTTQCSLSTDPDFQNQTSFTQSNGDPLNAAQLPYIVIPLPSTRFSYQSANIQPGAAALVIYNGQLQYGVFGDEGPDNIIGEASYAMASSLGIDPNPSTGGVDSGVTFIVFTGGAAVVDPIEDHQAAVTLGTQLAQALVQNN